MSALTLLLPEFIYWWLIIVPAKLVQGSLAFLSSLEHQLSFFLIIRTFTKPWRGEYRKDLVTFARLFGMFLKTPILLAELVILALFICLCILVVLSWFILPAVLILGIFGLIKL